MNNHQITILYIDDDPTNRYVIRRVLHNAGFRVTEADSGAAGLEAIAQHNPDLIILDVQLPDITGFEVCQRIKASRATAHIPVLHLSAAYVNSHDRAQGLECGADGYLVQPVEPIELLATIRALLRMHAAEKSARTMAQEWQTTFDAIRDGVCLLDPDGKVIRCNRTVAELLDREPESLVGADYRNLLSTLAKSDDALALDRLQQTRQRVSQEVCVHSTSAGRSERWFSVMLDPVLGDTNELTGAVFVLADISPRKRAEVEREQLLLREQAARTASETANRLKDEFLATLSHELRSPLNAIMGWVMLLKSRICDPIKTQQAIDVIERNARSQVQLVEDLLDVSRIIQGKMRLDVRPIDLILVIEAAIEGVRPAAEAKGIALDRSFDPAATAISGDPDRLQQVMWNLLANAIKFTPQGGQVRVELAANNNGVEVSVSDTGQGIKPEFVPFVFDRFRQEDGSTTRAFNGLGLGLSIVRHLVELHGGSVQVSSPGEGKGATFRVCLPTVANRPSLESRQPPISTSSAPLSLIDLPSLDGIRILVVDDEADSCDFLTVLLEAHGAEVTAAGSAQVVPQLVLQQPIDLLITDIGMPGEDGYSLLQNLQALSHEPLFPTIALTSYNRPEDRLKSSVLGFQAHLAKPIDPDTLILTIASLVDRRCLQGRYAQLGNEDRS